MKNYTLALFLFLATTSSIFAQITFEKGYFITANGTKTECFIKNEDWENNPSKFEYKLTKDGDSQLIRLPNLKTVEIYDAFKYEKHTVPYNDSDRSIGKLTYQRSPKFEDTTLMLRVLLEGKATLFSYVDGDKRAFYFKKDDGLIQPLIYNVYTNENRAILYNKRYQQQLLTELPCGAISEKKITRVDYQASDLKAFFTAYNECKGANYVAFSKAKKGVSHLKAFAGAYSGSAVSDLGISSFFSAGAETEAGWSPTFGVELEYVFPFNQNKWSVFVAPNYNTYEGESEFLDLSVQRRYKLEYSAIQVPVGFRHYMFLNNTSKLFLSGAVLFDLLLDARGSGNVNFEKDEFRTSGGFSFGLGYTYDKYSVEVRYIPNRELLENNARSSIKLEQFGITLGYTIF
jgi:hypothetical protein